MRFFNLWTSREIFQISSFWKLLQSINNLKFLARLLATQYFMQPNASFLLQLASTTKYIEDFFSQKRRIHYSIFIINIFAVTHDFNKNVALIDIMKRINTIRVLKYMRIALCFVFCKCSCFISF